MGSTGASPVPYRVISACLHLLFHPQMLQNLLNDLSKEKYSVVRAKKGREFVGGIFRRSGQLWKTSKSTCIFQ